MFDLMPRFVSTRTTATYKYIKPTVMATQTATREKLESASQAAIQVTPDNFRRAESDMYFTTMAITEGGFGKFHHRRELFSIDKQTVVRGNRDTIYSSAIFDL